LALALASALDRCDPLTLVAAYLLALACWELPLTARWLRSQKPAALWVLTVLLLIPGLGFVYRAHSRIAAQWGLVTLSAQLPDRLRLTREPAIAPPLLSGDRPQTFYVQAEGANRVTVQFAPELSELPAEPLGEGLFRVDYDPRRDGVRPAPDGEVTARIQVDNRSHERPMQAVTPLAHPRWFCSSPDRSAAATVSEETDELLLYAAGTLRSIPVGDGPTDCAFLDGSTIAVSHRYAASLWIVQLESRAQLNAALQTREIVLAAPLGRLTLSPDGGVLAVAQLGAVPAVRLFAWPSLAELERLPLQAAADWLQFGESRRELVVATRADAALHSFVEVDGRYVAQHTHPLGRPAVTMARAAGGRLVWVATTDHRPSGAPQLGNHFVQDQLLAFDTRGLELRARRFTGQRTDRQNKPGDSDGGGSPMGIGELPNGDLAVTFAGTDELWRIPSLEAEEHRLDLAPSGLYAPHGIVGLADGTVLVSSPAAGAIGVLRAGASDPVVLHVAPDDAALHARDPVASYRREGERGFYESTRSGIACQSCHLHASSDDAGYNLGDHRLAPVLTVEGLLGTAPYLRDGSYPRIEDLDEVAQTLYRGYLRIQPGRRKRLSVYMESLPRPYVSNTADRSAQRQGYAVFRRAHCPRCHTPPAFTNLGQLPLAALFPRLAARFPSDEALDVPSLLSVGSTAPYLNDGRAATLTAVLDRENPDDLHGATQSLSAAERSDLITFLETL
jgi:hypothetical protein